MLPLGAVETRAGVGPFRLGVGGSRKSHFPGCGGLEVGWDVRSRFRCRSVSQGPQPLSFLAITTDLPAVEWCPDACAGDTEVTMVSATAATTAPNHFFAVGVIIMVSFGPGDLALSDRPQPLWGIRRRVGHPKRPRVDALHVYAKMGVTRRGHAWQTRLKAAHGSALRGCAGSRLPW